jgi:hypothetical protein
MDKLDILTEQLDQVPLITQRQMAAILDMDRHRLRKIIADKQLGREIYEGKIEFSVDDIMEAGNYPPALKKYIRRNVWEATRHSRRIIEQATTRYTAENLFESKDKSIDTPKSDNEMDVNGHIMPIFDKIIQVEEIMKDYDYELWLLDNNLISYQWLLEQFSKEYLNLLIAEFGLQFVSTTKKQITTKPAFWKAVELSTLKANERGIDYHQLE